jgi:hypothetical protein
VSKRAFHKIAEGLREALSVARASELGALRLDADEIAAFEKWMTEPSKPTPEMIEVAKAHKALLLRQKR